MKKLPIVMVVLALALGVTAQTTPPQPGQPASPQQPAAGAGQTAAPQQKKEIKDPAEYNLYMNALNQTDPNAKAIAFEGFLQTYQNSVVKEDALEQLMAAYDQARNQPKMIDTANRLLQVNPNNLRALAILAYQQRAAAQSGQNPQQNLALAAQHAQRGLQALQTAPRPEGMSDGDWQKFRTQVGAIFNSALGIAALNSKNYAAAQQNLRAAATLTPEDFSIVYPLALADLESQPPNYVDGLWWIARAQALAPPQMKPDLIKYGRAKYVKYHGGDDGWNELLQASATSPLPPPGFSIKPAPTPAEQAAKLVQSKPVAQMSFDEIEMVLTSGNPQAADAVWGGIKEKPIALEGKLIQATANQMQIAATVEDIDKNRPDVTVTMTAPIPARLMPKVGSMVQFEGTPVSFTPNPFMVTMTKGSLLTKKPAAVPPKKSTPATRRKTSR